MEIEEKDLEKSKEEGKKVQLRNPLLTIDAGWYHPLESTCEIIQKWRII